ncbi:nuclear transport factor 2 family protein [Streptomyces sp. NPDC059104]|uniref:nuclear transport factor 2 family protein n=1 Tax=Streptomyces sp. NPDC059104 TaxID=3346729 RepID=UPI0036A9B3DE
MPTQPDDIADLRAQVGLMRDRIELRELFDRYVLALDALGGAGHDEAAFAELCTEDATFLFPIGGCRGVEGFTAFQREARERWARTHHLSTNHSVTLDGDGDGAALRVHLIATHVHHADPESSRPFEVGGYYDARAVRTAAGWRLSEVAFHVVWSYGDPLPEFAGARR